MRALLLRACLLLGTFLAACAAKDHRSTLDRVLERGVLVVGTEPEFAPFESRNAAGEFVGYDMDMARELAKDLGVKLEIQAMSFNSLPTALGSGEIDVIISGMTATPERAKNRSFTKPYFHTRLCLLVNATSGIEGPDDLHGKRIVVKQGTTGDTWARENIRDATIIPLQKEGECALDVVNGGADAFVYDQLSILRHHNANPKATRALLEPLSQEPYCMAVRRGDTKFVERLDRFLDDIEKDGRRAALRAKYGFDELPDGPR